MSRVQEDKNSRFKLAQLWHFVNQRTQKTHLNNRIVNEILKDDFNFNCKVTVNSNVNSLVPTKFHLKDCCTALHFLHKVQDIDTFTILLKRGADVTVKNGQGQTVLHAIMTDRPAYHIEKQMPFVIAVLSTHVKLQNSANPHDDSGISHLHAACMANHVEAAELFLENGASIDQAVNSDAQKFAGYTPLHFAVAFNSFKVAKTLADRGANVNAQTAKGLSSLDLLIANKPRHRYLQEDISEKEQRIQRLLIPQISEKEQLIKLLMRKGAFSAVGLSAFQIACNFRDLALTDELFDRLGDIDYAVPMTSALFSGNTALHFAADNRIKVAEILVKQGAKIEVANAEGWTPIDVCIDEYSMQDVGNVLSFTKNGPKIILSDGKTRLLDVIPTMRNIHQFKVYLQDEIKDTVVPSDSTLWPGYSLLHLAVTFSKNIGYHNEKCKRVFDKTTVRECLNRGLSVNIKDAKGQTPVHLAFSQGKNEIVELLCERLDELDEVSNLVDRNDLSYLHIACAMKNKSLVEKLISTRDVHVAYKGERELNKYVVSGSTPLHIAAANGAHNIAEMLLTHGANLYATDKNGFTSIHWLARQFSVSLDNQQIASVLFTSMLANPEDRVVDGLGMSHLHIACLFNDSKAVKKLLDLGSDVNAVFKYNEDSGNHISRSVLAHLAPYLNFTPLQMAIEDMRPSEKVLDVLLSRSEDIFVKGSNDCSKDSRYNPIDSGKVVQRFFQLLWNQRDMQKRMEERLALTKLHIACYLKNEEAVISALTNGVDVNVPVRADSVIFAGCTPLHLLVTITDLEGLYDIPKFFVAVMMNLLIDHGADVTIQNAGKDTPIHVFYKNHVEFTDADRSTDLLLNAHKNFSVNPTNVDGLSHFHLACLWHNAQMVENFLLQGFVDVNRPVDYFERHYAGCTPLHLALISWMEPDDDWTNLLQTVDLLLQYGADVSAKDVYGDTPLHKPAVLRSPNMSIFEKLVSYGGDIQSENIQGQTPIEVWPDFRIRRNPFNNLTIFQIYDYNINRWNRLTGEGYIANIFLSTRQKLSECSEFEKFTKYLDVRTVDDVSRSAIHNAVALSPDKCSSGTIENYVYAIDSFVALGIDIDHRDKSGQTALHYAVRMKNVTGVEALLACGADVNILDDNGKPAISYSIEYFENNQGLAYLFAKNITSAFRLHMKKSEYLRINVSQLNENVVKEVQNIVGNRLSEKYNISMNFFHQIDMTKTLDIGTNSLTLFNFLSETGAATLYCLLPKYKRKLIDDYFKSVNFENLKELSGIIKLQLKKMTTRLELIDSALHSLRTLLGFSVPDLCEQISRYLLNSDLKNLIESTALKTRKRKLSEIDFCLRNLKIKI